MKTWQVKEEDLHRLINYVTDLQKEVDLLGGSNPALAKILEGLTEFAAKYYPLSREDLSRLAKDHKPPQSWYDEDHSGLFDEEHTERIDFSQGEQA